jgi:hypothetical protein
MGDHRWRGYAHQELYTMINGGPGVAASIPLESKWKSVSEALEQIDMDIHEGLAKIGADWEGSSADAAQSALSPLAQWAADARTGSDVMKTSAQLQGEYIADARKEMPAPLPVTTEAPSTGDKILGALGGPAGMMHVIDQQKDHEAQEAAQENAEQKAITVMNNYESSSTWNSSTLGDFVPPPKVVIDTPPPSGVGTYNQTSANYTSPTGTYNGPTEGTTTTSGWTPPPSTPPTTTLPPPNIIGDTKPSGWTPPGTTLPTPPQPPIVQPRPPMPPLPPQIGFPPPGGGVKPPNTGLRPPTGPGGRPLGPGGPGGSRPGMPTGPGGRGGMPGGPGGAGQGGPGQGGPNASNALGRGGAAGAGSFGPGGPGGAGGPGGTRGGAGGPGAGGAGGRGGEGEEDLEHKTADYLVETDNVFGDERMVAPPVIGES